MNYDHYYFLAHAIDRLGRRMFPGDWTGYELNRFDMMSPDELAAKREPLEAEIMKLDLRDEELETLIRKSIKTEEQERLQSEREEIWSQRGDINFKLYEMGTPDAAYRKRYSANTRRDAVLEEVYGALRSQKVRASMNGGAIIDWAKMEETAGFRIAPEMSLAALPREVYGGKRRHASVLVMRETFDAWLDEFHPPPAEPGSAEDRFRNCEDWFRREVDKSGKRILKPDFQTEAKQRFGLSVRKSNEIWRRVAPKSWQKPGAPSRENK